MELGGVPRFQERRAGVARAEVRFVLVEIQAIAAEASFGRLSGMS